MINVNVVGIICEYNPFHNGHLHHLNKIKEMYKDSIIVLVLSGNYLERGEISILNKYEKTKIALEYGVDIVLELPYNFAVQSADIFAYGALSILNKFKVDTLVFGSESDNIDNLVKLAKIQLENKDYDKKVQELLDEGVNYPTALSKALKSISNIEINSPNDLLALSYIKQIIKKDYKITPISIKRTNNYHDTKSNDKIVSASNIREKIKNKENIKKFIPPITYDILKNKDKIFFIEDYYQILKYQIISNIDNLDEYLTVDEGIDGRIKKYIYKSNSYEELINNVKTKRYTYNKLSRMFMHILTSFKKKDNDLNIRYIRVLGLNSKGKKYLNNIKKKIDVQLITKFSDYSNKDRFNELKLTYIYYLVEELDKTYNMIDEEIKSKIIFKD